MNTITDHSETFSLETHTTREPNREDFQDLQDELNRILSHQVNVNDVYNLAPGEGLFLQDSYLKELYEQRLHLLMDLNVEEEAIGLAMEKPAYYFAQVTAAIIEKTDGRVLTSEDCQGEMRIRKSYVSILNPQDLGHPETLISVIAASDPSEGQEVSWQEAEWKIESTLRGNLERPAIVKVVSAGEALALTLQRYNVYERGYETIAEDHPDHYLLLQAISTDLYHGVNHLDKAHDNSAYVATHKHLYDRDYAAVPREYGRSHGW